MGQQKGGKSVSIATGKPLGSPMMGPMSFIGALTGGAGGIGSVRAKSVQSPTSPSSTVDMPSISSQGNIGVNSVEQPFNGLGEGYSQTKRTPNIDTDIDLPDTSVGLSYGSKDEDEEEENGVKAPTIEDEEKRREASDKAKEWLS